MITSTTTEPANGSVLDCGHVLVRSTTDAGYAQRLDGSTVCYACATAEEITSLRTANSCICYLSETGQLITTWTGAPLGRVTLLQKRETAPFGNPYAQPLYTVHATDVHGQRWYGTSAGRGMCCHLRKYKPVTIST